MKKIEINKLDKIAREKAKENFKRCIVCGKDNTNIHHIEGRRIMSCRWYLPNLVALCPLCHTFGLFSAHQSPMRMRKFFVDSFGSKWERDLIKQANKTFKGNFETVLDYLEGKIKNYC